MSTTTSHPTARVGWAQRPRREDGYTLIEVLLVVVVAGIILVPVLAWSLLALRTHPVTRDGLVRVADAGLLGAYLPGDVATAGAAADAGEDCVGGGPSTGQDGTVRLVLGSNRMPQVRTVYSEAPLYERGAADASRRSVWRRECSAEDGRLLDAVQVFEDVRAGSTRAVCSTEGDDTPCRQVEFRTTPVSDDAPVVVRGTRRADLDRQSAAPEGNRLPVARIGIVSQSSTQPLTITFTAADSTDPDGTIVAYRWKLQNQDGVVVHTYESAAPGGPTWQFPTAGQYSVVLSVTDDEDATSTTYKRIDAQNRTPTAVIAVTPTVGQAGVTEFAFNGRGSFDPDGSIASYRWTISRGGALPDLELTGPEVRYTFPAGTVGTMAVTLVVADHQGASGTATKTVTISADPPGQQPGDPPVDAPPGSPVARFTVAPGSSPNQWHFDASGSYDDGQIVSYSWDFGLLAGSGSGPTASHTYAHPGTYLVVLEVTDDVGLRGTAVEVVTVPGTGAPPTGVRRDGAEVVWHPVPGSSGYQVQFEFITGAVCAIRAEPVEVGPSATPSRPIPSSQCPPGGVTRTRVASLVNGELAWSGWVDVTPPGGG